MMSRPDQNRRALPGFLIILGLLAVALAIFFADSLRHLTRDTFEIVAVFPEATRLRPDAEVWVAGNAVGSVREVAFLPVSRDSTRRVAVTLRLPEDVRPLLHRNTVARLRLPRMLSDQIVDLQPIATPSPALQPGDTLYGTVTLDLAQLMDRARRLRGSIQAFTEAAQQLNDAHPGVSADALDRLATNAAAVRDEFATLASGSEEGTLRRMLGDTATRAAFARAGRNLGEVNGRIHERLATFSAGDARTRLEDLQRQIANASANLARLDSLLAEPNGFAGRMLRDSALTAAVNATRAQMDSLIAEAKKNPLRFVF